MASGRRLRSGEATGQAAPRSLEDDSPPIARTALRGHEDDAGGRPVVAVTSRPPVVGGPQGWRPAAGGLTPIVRAALDRRGGAWVSWNGGASSPPRSLEHQRFDLLTFSLGRRDGKGFYAGYANRTLWPLLHEAVVPPVFDPSWWPQYRDANAAFARAADLAAARAADEAVLWVHDYHLLLVPGRLRELGVDNPVAFFLHTPFPSPSVFARLPQRTEVLEGLAGADVVAFQTEAHRYRFLQVWSAFGVGQPPRTMVLPASVDVPSFQAAAADPQVLAAAARLRRRFRDRVVVLGVERLDYTKGIPERLKALERLLERRADLRSRLAYVQLATPSRETLPEYRRLRAHVERELGRLNGRFTRPGEDVPFRYLHRQVSHRQLLAYYLAADVALVTPLCDGMNLVAKEFAVVQAATDGAGALVLSEFAGAAAELGDAFVCNPFDADGTAAVVEQALDADEDERRKRLATMAEVVAAHDVGQWADTQLAEAEAVRHGSS